MERMAVCTSSFEFARRRFRDSRQVLNNRNFAKLETVEIGHVGERIAKKFCNNNFSLRQIFFATTNVIFQPEIASSASSLAPASDARVVR